MDWGFADAVLALGPMEEVLSAGIRELLIKSLESYAKNLQTSEGEDVDAEVFFVTHSLGSYLALIACNSDLLGPQGPELSNFQFLLSRGRRPPTLRHGVDADVIPVILDGFEERAAGPGSRHSGRHRFFGIPIAQSRYLDAGDMAVDLLAELCGFLLGRGLGTRRRCRCVSNAGCSRPCRYHQPPRNRKLFEALALIMLCCIASTRNY